MTEVEINSAAAGTPAASPTPALEVSAAVPAANSDAKTAPFVRRAGAWFIDMSLVSLLWLVVFAFALVIFLLAMGFSFFRSGFIGFGDFEQFQNEPSLLGPVLIFLLCIVLALALVSHAYFVIYEKRTGTTPGKRALGLTVRSIDGSELSWGQVWLRDFARWYVDGLFFIVAVFSMALTSRKQRIGDLLAKTEVRWTPEADLKKLSLYLRADDFKKISALLPPEIFGQPVEPRVRTEYLKFAYSTFISGRAAEFEAHRPRWLSYIRERLRPAADLKLDDETLLRFFAAMCEV